MTPIESNRTNESASSTTATDAAAAVSPLSIRPKMYTEETSVLNGRLPVMMTSAPNSPIALASASAIPERTPGKMLGKITRLNEVRPEAPSERAASSASGSSSCRTGCTVRTTNGRVTNIIASTIAVRVNATSTPIGERGPYRARSVRPATIVGSANGRSMIALTSDFPRNSSRTSTHAVIVPSTAFRSDTATAVPMVNFKAATDSGLETASQKPCDPAFVDSHTRAAMGSTTRPARKVVTKPRDRAVPALSPEARTRRGAGAATLALLASDAADPALDPRHDARLRIEEALLHLVPAAEPELVDRELARPHRELLPVLREHARHYRPVAPIREDLLCGRSPQESEELVRLVPVRARLRDSDGILDQDRRLRDDEGEVLPLLLTAEGLVLVREQDVTPAGQERVHRVASALVLGDDVLEEPEEVGLCLPVRLALLPPGAVGGHDVPARASRLEGGGRDDLDARPDEVVPALDVLRVAVPHDEDDHRVGDHALVGLLLPLRIDDAGLRELIHVRGEGELDDVGLEARDDRPRLVARGPIGLGERDAVAVGRLPERGDEGRVRVARSRVRDEAQRHASISCWRGADGYAGGDDGDHESCERNGEARSTHSFSSHGQGWRGEAVCIDNSNKFCQLRWTTRHRRGECALMSRKKRQAERGGNECGYPDGPTTRHGLCSRSRSTGAGRSSSTSSLVERRFPSR